MEHTVGLFRCAQYKLDKILTVLGEAVSKVGFSTQGFSGKTVLLKPNMLGAYPPEMGITTHPAFLEAAIILFKELGCRVWVGDSANGIFPIDCVWERTGIRDVCKRQGVEEKVFERESGTLVDGLFIAKPVLEADAIVNLPRFKTHGLTVLTVATKNLYGCVPGLMKTRYHRENIDRNKFAKLVVRIAEIAKPQLNLVDGITAMDGNGPSAGRLLDMGTIIAGVNHHAVDTVCARLIDLNPLDVDTIEAARSLGVWNMDNEIKLVGEPFNSCKPPSFNLPATFTKGMRDWWISLFVIDRIWGGISIKPKINRAVCQRCGLCVKSCPVGAIIAPEGLKMFFDKCDVAVRKFDPKGPAPRVINKTCVECYCCHEICPYKAIDLNESLGVRIGRFLGERRIRKLNNAK